MYNPIAHAPSIATAQNTMNQTHIQNTLSTTSSNSLLQQQQLAQQQTQHNQESS